MSRKKNRRFGEEGKNHEAQVLWSLAVAIGVAVLAVMNVVSPGGARSHQGRTIASDTSATVAPGYLSSQSLPE